MVYYVTSKFNMKSRIYITQILFRICSFGKKDYLVYTKLLHKTIIIREKQRVQINFLFYIRTLVRIDDDHYVQNYKLEDCCCCSCLLQMPLVVEGSERSTWCPGESW